MSRRTLVLGIGNPLLTDDGAGIHAVNALKKQNLADVEARECVSDFDLLEALNGDYSRIIIVDVIKTGGKPGTVYRAFLSNSSVIFSHHLNLNMINNSDRDVILLAIEAEDIHSFSEKCTPEVERAISEVLNFISELSMEKNQ
jgi:hydrogenase maturation protease